jgi:Flp pilus assembly protein TadB
MSRSQVAALVAVLTVAALASARHAFRRPTRRLAEIRAVLESGPIGRRPGRGSGRSDRFAAPDGLVAVVERRLGDDLRTIDSSAQEVATRVVLASLAGTGSTALAVASMMALGRLRPSPWWLAVASVVGLTFAWTTWRSVHERIDRARRDLQRATNDVVQLMAVALTTDQSVEEALRFAVSVGGGPGTERIRHAVLAAPQRGIPIWEALEHVGRLYGRRELCELATSIERHGTQGVSITDTVSGLASTMRAAALDELERDADKANANLSGPTITFVVTTVVFLAYPLAIRISTAFGG